LFFFNKPKNFLKDLIPDNHIDIHSHVLPSIDDGAKNIEETLFLVNSLTKMGVSKIITTPHILTGFYDNTKASIQAKEQEIKPLLEQNNISIPITAAAEYLIDDYFVTLFKKQEILTLKDNYVLVEISYLNPPINLFEIIFDLQVAGYKPILAHPERYQYYHKNFDEYLKLKNAGCAFQLNLLSTVGYYGKEVAEAAQQLLKKGLIDYVGTDVHHQKHIESFDKKLIIKEESALKEAISNNQFFK
jgi:protein-tyrosine phosphatase